MSKGGFKFVLDTKGVGELLKSAEMRQVIEEYANEVRNRAGDGYEMQTHFSEQRVIANVYTATEEAILDNLENNTLLKAAGR